MATLTNSNSQAPLAQQPHIVPIRGAIKHYDWGDGATIPSIIPHLNQPSSETPSTDRYFAEYWLGTHPNGSATLATSGASLHHVIANAPEPWLNRRIARSYDGTLPFLFKILAARQALSLQCHPTKKQSAVGYALAHHSDRQSSPHGSAIPPTTSTSSSASHSAVGASPPNQSVYKDTNHKPELMVAHSTFWAMCGVRDSREIMEHFNAPMLHWLYQSIGAPPDVKEILKALLTIDQTHPKNAQAFIKRVVNTICEQYPLVATATGSDGWHTDRQSGNASIDNTVGTDGASAAIGTAEAATISGTTTTTGTATPPASIPPDIVPWWWVVRLHQLFPNTLTVVAPLLLNTFALKPQQGLFIAPTTLHAYLHGSGYEIMATSDNVLRGGMTAKQIEIEELMKICRTKPGGYKRITGVTTAHPRILSYLTPATEFALHSISCSSDAVAIPHTTVPTIALMTSGTATIQRITKSKNTSQQETVTLQQGQSVYLRPTTKYSYTITGDGMCYCGQPRK